MGRKNRDNTINITHSSLLAPVGNYFIPCVFLNALIIGPWASLTSQRPALTASLMGSGIVPRAGGLGGRFGPATDQASSVITIILSFTPFLVIFHTMLSTASENGPAYYSLDSIELALSLFQSGTGDVEVVLFADGGDGPSALPL